MASSETTDKKLATNRKAFRDYHILNKFEAGIELLGTEVKSIRAGHISLAGGFARVEKGQVFLYNINILPYELGGHYNHEADRKRRILLHKREIEKLTVQTEQKGHTIVPLSAYITRGIIKIELGLCKSKTHGDKRETLKRQTADREAQRAIAGARRR